MSLDNLKSFDPFAETDGGDDKKDYIHIRIQQRNGRKTLTTIQGLPKEIDPKRVLKFAKKEFGKPSFNHHNVVLGSPKKLL
ncbi:Eukaryotic translation initiation factor eIF-1, variant 2 [Orbilia oligospora]|nr:Eukaryotic translation initiation factor eIF-1, variant 2 [Orbilia oligospora]